MVPAVVVSDPVVTPLYRLRRMVASTKVPTVSRLKNPMGRRGLWRGECEAVISKRPDRSTAKLPTV